MGAQLYDSPGNYDFIWIGDDGTYDGLEANLHIKFAENQFDAHQGDSKTIVTNNQIV